MNTLPETQISLSYDNNSLLSQLCGEQNAHLRQIEEDLGIQVAIRGDTISISGTQNGVGAGQNVIEYLWSRLKRNKPLDKAEVEAALRFINQNGKATMETIDPIKTARNHEIMPRSPGQAVYIEAMRKHEMTFGLGPAGTGKTYLAVALAVSMYKEGLIDRMVFTRPAVEAGENLGFLPGDMQEKIDPYLRPIFDALHDAMPADQIGKKILSGDIEVAPLAFMRGRTLKNAFVILDEAQNTTQTQMKMFLTRMGEGTRMVINGDPTQIDLKKDTMSGLREAEKVLSGIPDVAFVRFTDQDVVRHKLVGKIIKAYDNYDKTKK